MSTSVRSKRVGAGRVIFGVLSAVVFSAMAMVLAGCSGGETTGGGGGGGGLVLGSNEAWTDGDNGFIFRSNGQFVLIYRGEGNTWYGAVVGTWSASGNRVTIVAGGESRLATYSISGDELTFTSPGFGEGVLTRTSVNVEIEDITPPARSTQLTENVWTHGSITSNTDRAVWYQFNVVSGRTYWVSWDDAYSGPETGTLDIEITVVYSDGTIIFADDDWESTPPSFTASRSGTVSIRVTPLGSDDYGTFGVMYTTTDPRGNIGGDRQLVLGANEAWVATEEGMTIGFIFKSNGDLVQIMYMGEYEYNGWYGYVAGWWSTSGNTITLAIDQAGEIMTGTYRVSGNTVTITIEGDPITFTRTGNIRYTDIGDLMKSPDNGETQLNKIFSQTQSSLFKKPSPQKKSVLPGKLSFSK